MDNIKELNVVANLSGTKLNKSVQSEKVIVEKFVEERWNDCLKIIKDNIGDQAFNTWFVPIKAKSWDDNEKSLTIQMPSQFFQEWIEEHYYNLLQNTIRKVFNEPDAQLFYDTVVVKDVADSGEIKIHSLGLKYPPQRPPVQIKAPNKSSKVDYIGRNYNNLLQRYAFESFVVGKSNQLAVSASKAVSDEPGGTRFNPFFIYGSSGLGKTHLAQAIGNHIAQHFPEKRILYTSSEQFTIDFVSATQNRKNSEFIKLYRDVDVLIIDDIQFLSGKEKTQEKLFYTHDALYHSGKQIILTADKAPRDIQDINERLVSRFMAGLTVEIKQPDYNLRADIVRRKSKSEGIDLSEEVVDIIAKNVTKSIRELEGCVIKLTAIKTLDRKPITPELAKEIILGLASEPKPITVDEIKEKVGTYYNIKPEVMISKSRKQNIAMARQMAIYISRKYTNLSLKEIGTEFGGRDHSTVLHSCRAIQDYIDTDKKVQEEFENLEMIFANR